MNLVYLFACTLVINIQAKKRNDFVIEYFSYKKASSVVGLSCNIIEGILHDYPKLKPKLVERLPYTVIINSILKLNR